MNRKVSKIQGLSRREFLQAGVAGATMLLLPEPLLSATKVGKEKTDVWVFHGEDKSALIQACLNVIDENGGLGDDVKRLTLKVNAAWIRTPRQGADTHPELVEAFLKGCRQRGVRELLLPENTCDSAPQAFRESGISAAAQNAGAKLINLKADPGQFQPVKIEQGQRLREAEVARGFLETDAVVNMPVLKHHGATGMSGAMKNWMGAVRDRGYWHRNDLNQCIADFSSFLQPRWTLIDATRVLQTRGPKGPSRDMTFPNRLILSRDQVAADAYASRFLTPPGPERFAFLRHAHRMGLGETDPARMTVHPVEVS